MKKNKEMKEYDELKIIGITMIILAFMVFGLAIVNLFLKNEIIRGFLYGADFIIFGVCFVRLYVNHHNGKILQKQFDEQFEKIRKIQKRKTDLKFDKYKKYELHWKDKNKWDEQFKYYSEDIFSH